MAVKISTGEGDAQNNYLRPELIGDFVQSIDGTIVECNTAVGGRRSSTAMHYQIAEDHGFTAIAPVVILDETDDMEIPVTGGRHLQSDRVGAHLADFDFQVVRSHFKGHLNGGFGGAIKNMSIGYATSAGKTVSTQRARRIRPGCPSAEPRRTISWSPWRKRPSGVFVPTPDLKQASGATAESLFLPVGTASQTL